MLKKKKSNWMSHIQSCKIVNINLQRCTSCALFPLHMLTSPHVSCYIHMKITESWPLISTQTHIRTVFTQSMLSHCSALPPAGNSGTTLSSLPVKPVVRVARVRVRVIATEVKAGFCILKHRQEIKHPS